MGILKGDVEILGLGNLLQILAMNRREGVLTLLSGMDKKVLHFSPGGIRLLHSTMNRVNRIGKILVRRRKITVKDLEALLKEQKLLGWKLGKIAVTSGLAKAKDVQEALLEQVEEDIFDMFMWPEAAFEFKEGRGVVDTPDNPLSSLVFDQNMTSILLEATRRADELVLIRKSVDEEMVLAKTGRDILVQKLGADVNAAAAILPLVNGKNTVRRIVAGSLYPRFATMHAIYLLMTNGYVQAINPGHGAVAKSPKS